MIAYRIQEKAKSIATVMLKRTKGGGTDPSRKDNTEGQKRIITSTSKGRTKDASANQEKLEESGMTRYNFNIQVRIRPR